MLLVCCNLLLQATWPSALLLTTVLEVTWMDGTGAVHASRRGEPDFSAFPGGLGVFGVMTKLLLQLTRSTNAELMTVRQNDTDMAANIDALLKV